MNKAKSLPLRVDGKLPLYAGDLPVRPSLANLRERILSDDILILSSEAETERRQPRNERGDSLRGFRFDAVLQCSFESDNRCSTRRSHEFRCDKDHTEELLPHLVGRRGPKTSATRRLTCMFQFARPLKSFKPYYAGSFLPAQGYRP